MLKQLIVILCSSASILALGSGQTAIAQQQDPSPSASGSGLEEIVVTARRREERVQTVPLAITAFDQHDIDVKHIQQVLDLSRDVPSLNVSASQSDANAIYSSNVRLRGLPGSVVYFADVPIGTTDFSTVANPYPRGLSPGFYYDLDNLEILKGPQGTLFGKNSIGGLISIEPKKPTNDYEGYVKATFGNYNDREFEGALNIPIVQDKLLVRIAGQSQQRDGYTKDVSNGNDYDNRDYYSWRMSVTFRPTDDLENYFIYDGYYQDTRGSSVIPAFANPGFQFSTVSLPGIANPVPITLGKGLPLSGLENPATATATYLALLKSAQAGGSPSLAFFPTISEVLAEQKALGPREMVGNFSAGIGKDYFYGFTNATTWDLSDNLTIKNIAGARIFKTLSVNDDFGPLPIVGGGDLVNNHGWGDNSVQYTDEIQLQGKSLNDKLSWVLGGFLENDHPLGSNIQLVTVLGTPEYVHESNADRSQALFAHGIYDLSDYVQGLRFTAGYRYTWDYVAVGETALSGIDAVTRSPNGMPSNCSNFGSDNNCYSSSGQNFSSYGWNLSLDEQLDPETLVYVRSGNAYRPGSANPNVPIQYQSLKPEHVTDVELGAKVDWTLFGAHLRTNADIFHTDYKSIQVSQLVQVITNQGNAVPETLETNAASAYLEGGELEATIVPIEGFEISPHASYLYTHYNKYPPVLGGGAGYAPPFGFTPKWQYGVTGTYHLPVDQSLGEIALSTTYSWTGHQYDNGAIGEIYPIIPSYDQLDIRVDWTNVLQRPLDFAFFMTNALNTTHVQGVFPIYTQVGFTSLVYNEPRMFGFSLKYRFQAPSELPEASVAYTPPPAVTPVPSVPTSYLVFFDFNRSELTVQAIAIVDQAAHNAGKVTQLEVTGHTDTVGSDAYNMRLSRRRAEAVAAQLEKDGIPSSAIEIVAKGKRDLLVPTADGVKEPQNRRVQIVYSTGGSS